MQLNTFVEHQETRVQGIRVNNIENGANKNEKIKLNWQQFRKQQKDHLEDVPPFGIERKDGNIWTKIEI